jgi:hypothetical protein
MADSIKMVALQTFSGNEGLIRKGKEFEVTSERRAEELEYHKLAAYFDEDEGIDMQELINNLNSHAKVDSFVTEHNLPGIPTREDGAKLDERKAAVEKALEDAGE